jgi:signal transduction histidine kinase
VLQEALQNALKHSGARRIAVSLRSGGDQIELTVRDSGVGFNVGANGGSGLGLTSMRERVTLVGGELVVLSTPQNGTTIRARVPVPEKEP